MTTPSETSPTSKTLNVRRHLRAAPISAALLAAVMLASSCSIADAALDSEAGATGPSSVAVDLGAADGGSSEEPLVESSLFDSPLLDSAVVHDIDIQFDQAAYDEMIAIYETDGEKEWIEATVTIDGVTIESVGLRLKGNSSLFGLTTETAQNPEELPWLLRFDKFVDDQLFQGHGDLVIRSNSTETSMNEAVALELLGLAGLATEEAVATRLTVNGGEAELRLAMELPDDDYWVETTFSSEESLLYKADSTGDYSYRGDDADSYDDVFDQKYGEDDLEPLIDFLDFINNADDATFANELGDWLDVESFATYLAFQNLIGNGDDIDGRGNNSYLHYDGETEMFTVVNWDLNLAFNTANVTGGARGAGLQPPAGGGGGRPQAGGGNAGAEATVGAGGSNVLAERFLASPSFVELYRQATADLTTSLFDSGAADAIIDSWVDTLRDDAGDLVDAATVDTDAAALRSWIEQYA